MSCGGSTVSGATRRYLHADHQGSIVAASTAAGALLQQNTYDAYGVPGAANSGRFQYTGQAAIPELGLYYYKARFYHPRLGRFLQTDPIGYEDDFNLYAYVGNDPLNRSDPTGLEGNTCSRVGSTSCGGTYGTNANSGDASEKKARRSQRNEDVEQQNQESAKEADVYTQQQLAEVEIIGKRILSSLGDFAFETWQWAAGSKVLGSIIGVFRGTAARGIASLPTKPGQLGHIFRNAPGHLADTPANRQLLTDVASNAANRVGVDRFGNVWSSVTRADGTQVWVSTRNGVIQNGGLNQVPQAFPNIVGP